MSCSRPLDSRTRPDTSCPSWMRRLARCGPANPVMPVIRYFMRQHRVPLASLRRGYAQFSAASQAMRCGWYVASSGGRGGQRLLDLRLEHAVEILGRDRADQLVGDAAVAADQKSLRHPVDAPVDGGTAVLIGADRGERVAVAAEEAAGVGGTVLVVDADHADALVLGELHQQRDRKSTRLNSSHLGISYA